MHDHMLALFCDPCYPSRWSGLGDWVLWGRHGYTGVDTRVLKNLPPHVCPRAGGQGILKAASIPLPVVKDSGDWSVLNISFPSLSLPHMWPLISAHWKESQRLRWQRHQNKAKLTMFLLWHTCLTFLSLGCWCQWCLEGEKVVPTKWGTWRPNSRRRSLFAPRIQSSLCSCGECNTV